MQVVLRQHDLCRNCTKVITVVGKVIQHLRDEKLKSQWGESAMS